MNERSRLKDIEPIPRHWVSLNVREPILNFWFCDTFIAGGFNLISLSLKEIWNVIERDPHGAVRVLSIRLSYTLNSKGARTKRYIYTFQSDRVPSTAVSSKDLGVWLSWSLRGRALGNFSSRPILSVGSAIDVEKDGQDKLSCEPCLQE